MRDHVMRDQAMRPHAQFPCVDFTSRYDFESHARRSAFEQRDLMAYEQRLATVRDTVMYVGTCAPCLRACTFTASVAGGTTLPDKRVLPNWGERLLCDCAEALSAAERATLHFLQSRVGMSAWTRLAVFALSAALRARLGELATITDAGAAHLVLVQTLEPAEPAFPAMRERLVEGGMLVFAAPFDPDATHTTERKLGWDYLDRLRSAGFRRGTAHAYRSEELGYLGAANFIFSAQA